MDTRGPRDTDAMATIACQVGTTIGCQVGQPSKSLRVNVAQPEIYLAVGPPEFRMGADGGPRSRLLQRRRIQLRTIHLAARRVDCDRERGLRPYTRACASNLVVAQVSLLEEPGTMRGRCATDWIDL